MLIEIINIYKSLHYIKILSITIVFKIEHKISAHFCFQGDVCNIMEWYVASQLQQWPGWLGAGQDQQHWCLVQIFPPHIQDRSKSQQLNHSIRRHLAQTQSVQMYTSQASTREEWITTVEVHTGQDDNAGVHKSRTRKKGMTRTEISSLAARSEVYTNSASQHIRREMSNTGYWGETPLYSLSLSEFSHNNADNFSILFLALCTKFIPSQSS